MIGAGGGVKLSWPAARLGGYTCRATTGVLAARP
jgi:hypothetical protein